MAQKAYRGGVPYHEIYFRFPFTGDDAHPTCFEVEFSYPDWAVVGHGAVLEKVAPENKRFKVAYTFKVTSVKVYRKPLIRYSKLKKKLVRFKPDARKVVMLSDHDFSMLKKILGVS